MGTPEDTPQGRRKLTSQWSLFSSQQASALDKVHMTLSSKPKPHPSALLETYLTGNESALTELLTSLRRKSVARVRRRVPDTEVEDIVQRTQLSFIEALHRISDTEKVVGFYYGIERNKIKDYYREKSKRRKQADFGILSTSETGDTRTPLYKVGSQEHWRQFIAALESLDDTDSLILWAHEIDDLSYTDIAVTLEMNVGTVRKRLSRAKEKLVKTLGPEFKWPIPRDPGIDPLDALLVAFKHALDELC